MTLVAGKSSAARRRGFTILELAIALAVIALIAALAIPAWFEREEVTLENACVLLAEDLRLAQNRAAALGEVTTFEFEVDGSGYRVSGPDGERITHPRTGRDFERIYSVDGVFEGVHISSLQLTSGRTLQFTSRGTTQGGGLIELSFQGERRLIEVEEHTGFITILGSTSGWRDDGN